MVCAIDPFFPFGLGGTVKSKEEEDDLINQLTNDNIVFRAAPGFAQVKGTQKKLKGSKMVSEIPWQAWKFGLRVSNQHWLWIPGDPENYQ